MPKSTQKLAVTEVEAARLYSLKTAEFLELVEVDALPGPEIFGGKYKRWSVAKLEAVCNGQNIEEEFET